MVLQKSQIGTRKNKVKIQNSKVKIKQRALEDGKESFFVLK